MHKVVQGHLSSFQAKHEVSDDPSKQFEAFLNFALFRSKSADGIDAKDLIYDGADPGIDGVMIFINDSYISSADEADAALSGRRRDAEVVIVFTQAKTSEYWSKQEINTFESAIRDFLSDEPAYPRANYLENAREVFDAVLRDVGRIRDGRPSVEAYFATTAREAEDREILAARGALEATLEATGYFSGIHVELLNRDSIIELWKAAEGQVESTLRVLGTAAFPKTPGIDEGYVVTVRARDFVHQILTDSNGRLRQRIFEENVRDFLGAEGDVNREMAETLADDVKQKRFGVLNNGITIISPDIRVGGLEISIKDFQIVNGCQTSNVLWQNREIVGEEATVMLKLIETSDPAVIDDIVRSTNRQVKVEEQQFLATLDAVKALERYFAARSADEELGLYFERRKNQFSHQDNVKAIRVFDIKEIARCVAAVFLDKPDLASRYPNRLTGELKDLVFNKRYHEEIYYTAAYTIYRLKLLRSNSRIDQRYSQARWHIAMALKYYLCGERIPDPTSKKIKSVCNSIETFMGKGDDETLNTIRDLCAAVINVEEVTRDRLKGNTLSLDIRAKALEFRKKHPPTIGVP